MKASMQIITDGVRVSCIYYNAKCNVARWAETVMTVCYQTFARSNSMFVKQ